MFIDERIQRKIKEINGISLVDIDYVLTYYNLPWPTLKRFGVVLRDSQQLCICKSSNPFRLSAYAIDLISLKLGWCCILNSDILEFYLHDIIRI